MYASKTSHKLVLAVIVVVLAVTTLAVGRSGLASAPVTTVQGPALRSMAIMSGTVSSSKPFKAAQVYIRNVDMRILYMVFTNAGQFRAVSLFPGNYEISVTAKGLKSDVRKVTLKAGDNPKLNLALQEVASSNQADANPLQNLERLYRPVASEYLLTPTRISILPDQAGTWRSGPASSVMAKTLFLHSLHARRCGTLVSTG